MNSADFTIFSEIDLTKLDPKAKNMSQNKSSIDMDEPQSALDDPFVESNDAIQYKPISYHWFYTTITNDKTIWMPMSLKDSADLEKFYTNHM